MAEENIKKSNKKISASELKNSQMRYVVLSLVIVGVLTLIGLGVFFAISEYFAFRQ
jgi:cell division septal protein FtsQ